MYFCGHLKFWKSIENEGKYCFQCSFFEYFANLSFKKQGRFPTLRDEISTILGNGLMPSLPFSTGGRLFYSESTGGCVAPRGFPSSDF